MTQSAVAFKDTFNGYEQRTDGLWVHKGRAYYGGVDQPGISSWQVGIRGQTDTANSYALVVQNRSQNKNSLYVRDDGLVFVDQLSVAQGIPTSAIQPNAVQQVWGFFTPISFAVPAINQWYETPAQVNVTPTTAGSVLRVECSTTFFNNSAGALNYVGLGWNGTAVYGMQASQQPTAGYLQMASFIWYSSAGQFPAGVNVRLALFLQSNAGAVTTWNGMYTSFYVTEQKR